MYDLFTREVTENPYSTYASIREKYKICQVNPGPTWVLSRFEDVSYALKNHQIFTSTKNSQMTSPSWIKKECHRDFFMWSKDPPEHRRYRATIDRPFLKSVIADLQPLAERTARDLTDTFKARRDIEFLEDFSYPYVSKVLGHITGLQESNCLINIRSWIRSIQLLFSNNPTSAEIKELETATMEQNAYFTQMIKDCRRNPGNNIVSSLVGDQINGKPLTDDMIINALNLVISAGFATTVHQLANTVVQLERRPQMRDLLIDRPDLIPAFVDEVLRLYSSVPSAHRKTAEDVIIHGTIIPKNSSVNLLLAAANRDPRKFSNPDEIDLSRKLREHLSFGYGSHICVGLFLARMELEVAVKYLLPYMMRISCPADNELQTNLF